jgi:uncharacterized DUF497 family protein
VKRFAWDPAKDARLRAERRVSFEDVIQRIAGGDLLDILEHANQERHHGQRVFVVELGGYAYLVPFLETENEIVLKTIIPSRKATKIYLGRGGERG